MIRLTRLNRQTIIINALVIAFIERDPDSLITLLSGERLHVREGVDEILERVLRYQRSVLGGAAPYRDE